MPFRLPVPCYGPLTIPIEHAVLGLRAAVKVFIPDTPTWVTDARMHVEYDQAEDHITPAMLGEKERKLAKLKKGREERLSELSKHPMPIGRLYSTISLEELHMDDECNGGMRARATARGVRWLKAANDPRPS